jgi:hypothetical protein
VHIINIRSINLKTISPLACRKQHQSSTRESARGVISRHKNTTCRRREIRFLHSVVQRRSERDARREKY